MPDIAVLQRKFELFVETNKRQQIELMARTAAHNRLIFELLLVLARLSPADLVADLRTLAVRVLDANRGALSALADAGEHADAADLARLSAVTISKIADDVAAALAADK